MKREQRLRIVAGRWRGRRLESAAGSRPTQQRVREAVFSRWGELVVGARLLELFCGGGAIGFEALSRGAASCCFVDARRVALAVVRSNAGELGVAVETVRCDLTARGWQRRLIDASPFDLIYADPPYRLEGLEETLCGAAELLHPSGELLVEHAAARQLPSSDCPLLLVERRRYGDTAISCLRARPAS